MVFFIFLLLGICWVPLIFGFIVFIKFIKNAGPYFFMYFLFHLPFFDNSFLGLRSDFTCMCCAQRLIAGFPLLILVLSLCCSSLSSGILTHKFQPPWPSYLYTLSLNSTRPLSSIWVSFLCTVPWKLTLGKELVQG